MVDRHEFSEAWLAFAITGSISDFNPFMRFVACWMAFNAEYSSDARGLNEWEAIKQFAVRESLVQHHQQLLTNDTYSAAVNVIGATGVGSDRDGRRHRINSVEELDEVLRCVYQIRCNLIHGGKHPANIRDRELCEAAFIVMAFLLSRWRVGLIPPIEHVTVRAVHAGPSPDAV